MPRVCDVAGCDLKPRSKNSKWCEKHYMRWYRHGDPLATAYVGRSVRKRDGYVIVRVPGHPLATGKWVPEHRRVLYDRVGGGPQRCFWCDRGVFWSHPDRRLNLHADHLNGVPGDNRPENLEVACSTCNRSRGGHRDPERLAVFLAARLVLDRHATEFDRERRLLAEKFGARSDAGRSGKLIRSAAMIVTGREAIGSGVIGGQELLPPASADSKGT